VATDQSKTSKPYYLCQRCGNCCRWPGDVRVNNEEVALIADFIDVPLDQLLERLKKRELDRFEREDRSFFERIYTGFHTMAATDPQRWMIVDGTPPKEELQATILQGVQDRLGITTS
jgi:thymidylate kinase